MYPKIGNAVGDAWIQCGGAVLVWAGGKIAGSAQVAHIGGDLIRAQTVNGVLTIGLKWRQIEIARLAAAARFLRDIRRPHS
jgi:hypothetical protein